MTPAPCFSGDCRRQRSSGLGLCRPPCKLGGPEPCLLYETNIIFLYLYTLKYPIKGAHQMCLENFWNCIVTGISKANCILIFQPPISTDLRKNTFLLYVITKLASHTYPPPHFSVIVSFHFRRNFQTPTIFLINTLKYRIKGAPFIRGKKIFADFRWQYLGNGSFDLLEIRFAKSGQCELLAHQFSSKSDKPFPR